MASTLTQRPCLLQYLQDMLHFTVLVLISVGSTHSSLISFLQYLQKDMPARYEADPDSLLTHAFQVKYSAKKMKK